MAKLRCCVQFNTQSMLKFFKRDTIKETFGEKGIKVIAPELVQKH